MSGGFDARFKHDGSPAPEVTESHTAYVGFLKVWADEARFGGIVLTPYREKKYWLGSARAAPIALPGTNCFGKDLPY
jgi:hypothetical protein